MVDHQRVQRSEALHGAVHQSVGRVVILEVGFGVR